MMHKVKELTPITILTITCLLGCEKPIISPDPLYLEEFSCLNGPLSLSLPPNKNALLNLDQVLVSETIETIHYLEGPVYYRLHRFEGMEIIVVEDPKRPEAYWISSIKISEKKWSMLSPLRIGDPVDKVSTYLPSRFQELDAIHLRIEGDTEQLIIKQKNRVITEIIYNCYTG